MKANEQVDGGETGATKPRVEKVVEETAKQKKAEAEKERVDGENTVIILVL